MDQKPRCSWCNLRNPLYVDYHDNEWGRPRPLSDAELFELLVLESFQAGLSWECVLNKRAAFRRAFDGFDPQTVRAYGEDKQRALMQDASIIRNRAKIAAAVCNATVFCDIGEQFGSFSAYLRTFIGDAVIFETERTTSPLSDALSADLKRRGMRFVGSTVIYSYLQAIGAVNAHEQGCFLHRNGSFE